MKARTCPAARVASGASASGAFGRKTLAPQARCLGCVLFALGVRLGAVACARTHGTLPAPAAAARAAARAHPSF